MKPCSGLVVALLLCLLAGCAKAPVSSVPEDTAKDKPRPAQPVVAPGPALGKKTEPAPAKRDNPEIVKNKEAGIIRGVVRWEGAAPASPTPRLRIDPATHGVADAVVRLSEGKTDTPPGAVLLSVEGGEYRPHVVVTKKGSTIELGTIDERADFQAAGAATFSETLRRGDRRTFPLSESGLIAVRSQLRPERAPAYVWVLDGPPGAKTETDGQFRLPPLPAGEHNLALWHEDWHINESTSRTARVRVTLGPDEGAEVRWALTEP